MSNYVICDPNLKFYFDEDIRRKKTYLGWEDGYNLLLATANNHPEHDFYVLQNTESYAKLKSEGYFDDLFPNKNVKFVTDDLINSKYPGALNSVVDENGRILNDVKKVVDEQDLISDKIDGIICLTVPSEGNIPSFSRLEDGTYFSDTNEWARSFYADYFIRNHPEIPMVAFHVDERFVYQNKKINRTARIPDLILGFLDREHVVETPVYEYPNGMVSKETVTRKVKSIFGNNDHISLLNFKPTNHPDWKLGSIDNFFKKEKSTYPIELFYNQLRCNYTDDADSDYAFVDRLATFTRFGVFDQFSPEQLQLYTNIKYNDQDIVNSHKEYFNESLPKDEMIEHLADSKYCLIIGNSKKTPMSQKVWECLSIGVIPFFLQIEGVSEYGSEHYMTELYDFMPELLVVHNAEEMKERMEQLENDQDYKLRVVKRLMANWDEGFSTGKVVSDAILNGMAEAIKNPVNSFQSHKSRIKVHVVEGPKMSGKDAWIKKDVEDHGYKKDEYLIVHSDMKAPNDYKYFSDQLDLNFGPDTRFDHIPEGWSWKDISFEKIKAVYFSRNFVSEYVYGNYWFTVNLGLIGSKRFPLGSLDLSLLKYANLKVSDLKLLSRKGETIVLRYFLHDALIRQSIEKAMKERKGERYSDYEKESILASNRAFKTMNRFFIALSKDFDIDYIESPWKERSPFDLEEELHEKVKNVGFHNLI